MSSMISTTYSPVRSTTKEYCRFFDETIAGVPRAANIRRASRKQTESRQSVRSDRKIVWSIPTKWIPWGYERYGRRPYTAAISVRAVDGRARLSAASSARL